MSKLMGFLEFQRKDTEKISIKERIKNFNEFEINLSEEEIYNQAARCIDCGVPFCHAFGCPLYNYIPDWNHLVYQKKWKEALDLLHATNNFPEFTGKVCPAPCEKSCVLDYNDKAVNIKHIELQIVDRGWENGWIKPFITNLKSGKKIAVIGSGPSGLAAAQQLVRKGHNVVVFEKSDKIGGLLRYGIPDFKLNKYYIDRRINQMLAEGVIFETEVNVGYDISAKYLTKSFDAILLALGSGRPRDLQIPGREAQGIYFAMEYLSQQNKINSGFRFQNGERISAEGKNVIVIGGGDTGSDCVGTSIRQGARKVYQVEILPKPPEKRTTNNPWPYWPYVLTTSTSYVEGCEKLWSLSAIKIEKIEHKVAGVNFASLEWTEPDNLGRRNFREIKGKEIFIKADMILLAMGFVGVEENPLYLEANIKLNQKGTIYTENFKTTSEKFFACGDAAIGPSLIVKAIAQGRKAAEVIDQYLKSK